MINGRIKSQEEFQDWLEKMDTALREFKAKLPSEVADKLDFSKESLQVLEDWLLESYETVLELKADDNYVIIDGARRYIGEVIKPLTNSHWYLTLDDTDITHEQVVLRKSVNELSHTTPFRMVTATVKLRQGDYLMEIANRVGNYHGKNLK